MTIVANKVAVGTTKVQLVPVDNVSRDLALHSKGSIHIGGSDVTAQDGYLMDNGDKLIIKLAEGEVLWAVSTNATSDVYVFVSKID
jgi:hypothetical protein